MKLILPDELQGRERAAYDAFAKQFPKNAVCVNVMLGGEPWDVRPLLLVNGSVYLYRLSCSLPFDILRHTTAEMEGFSLMPGWQTTVRQLPASERFLQVRPFVQATLSDHLANPNTIANTNPNSVAARLIETVVELDRRNLVHGHITPANVSFPAHTADGLILLDPRIAALTGRKDALSAPELEALVDPPATSDLYGLGVCLKALLQGRTNPKQDEVIERLLLASPRQRPDLESVVDAIIGARHAESDARSGSSSSNSGRGKILNAPTQQTMAVYRTSENRATSEVRPMVAAAAPLEAVRHLIPAPRHLAAATIVCVALLTILAWRFPKAYNELAYYLPVLASQHSADFVSALASGDRARVRSVARAAVIDRNPAAVNAILEDIRSGAQRPGFNSAIAKTAYRSPWDEEFSRSDMRTLVALTVSEILPEGLNDLAPLSSLHPALIVAIAAQLPPTSKDARLKAIPLTKLFDLGDPEGTAFEKLHSAGVNTVGDPEAMALAHVIAGTATTASFDVLIGSSPEIEPTLNRLAALLPVVMSNTEVGEQLLAAIRDRGGDLGTILSWFDIDTLVGWGSVSPSAKLLLLLQQVPSAGLSASHYADLLKFPLPAVREKAALQLRGQTVREAEASLLVLLASDQNRLSREQTVALISGLSLDPQKREPFVAVWFKMQPPADTVLLILLGRAAFDNTDRFNLEASRYLKSASWTASSEILKLLAQHPEPLARTLAYAKLDPSVPEQKQILQDRVSTEKDNALLKLVTAKLAPQ